MVKTKTAQKQKEKVFLAFSVVSLSFLFVWSIFAQNVPQEIGFKDVKFSSLNRELCQECHGSSLVDTHHDTSHAVSGNCVFCHGVQTQAGDAGVSLERNCMSCHEQSPHHATEAAKNKECRSCHDSPGVSDYSTEVPTYEPSKVTPTLSNCRNCHGEGVVDGQKVVGARDTHHGISFQECNICHDGIFLLTNQEQNDKKGENIRICERCHNVKALHEVVPHVEKESCIVCHGGISSKQPNNLKENGENQIVNVQPRKQDEENEPSSSQSEVKDKETGREHEEEPSPKVEKETFTIGLDILFEFGKSELLPGAYQQLDELFERLDNEQSLAIEIHGHTDNIGLRYRNQKLSEKRARSVADYLITMGIDKNRISVKGHGEMNPIADNSTQKGRQKNRRVEIILIARSKF